MTDKSSILFLLCLLAVLRVTKSIILDMGDSTERAKCLEITFENDCHRWRVAEVYDVVTPLTWHSSGSWQKQMARITTSASFSSICHFALCLYKSHSGFVLGRIHVVNRSPKCMNVGQRLHQLCEQ